MLLDEKVSFEINESRILLTHFHARPNIINQIKIVQIQDEQLCKIQNKLVRKGSTFCCHCGWCVVIWF